MYHHLHDSNHSTMRPGIKYSFNYSFPGRGLHIPTFCKLMDTFMKPLNIQFGHPRFKWLIPNTYQMLEYILCTHLEWSHYLHSSPSNLFLSCQSYDISKSLKLKVACWMKRHLKLVLPRWWLVINPCPINLSSFYIPKACSSISNASFLQYRISSFWGVHVSL